MRQLFAIAAALFLAGAISAHLLGNEGVADFAAVIAFFTLLAACLVPGARTLAPQR
ncbi:MAG: hypothetical protein JO347_10435 [Candidatus Eremiobacteraeota bacterium]|nr:hypothetical protein [Candidatus Eremiobacteraeota bacterium]